MNKKSLSIIFIFIILFLSGCSNSNNDKPIRNLDSSNDKIKFLDIDWLTDRKEVEKIFVENYGNDFKVNSELNPPYVYLFVNYSSKKAISDFVGATSNDSSLLWEFGNQKIKSINAHYYSNNKENLCYLFKVEINFDNPSIQGFDDLVSLYNNVYNRTRYDINSDECRATYTDSNKNSLYIVYEKNKTSEYLQASYVCDEIGDIVFNKLNEANGRFN